jgi:pyruvate ferredoxin oxidoreductase beta subunit
MATLKELARKEDLLTGGHRLCAGCGAPVAVRQILKAAKTPVVAGCATCCLEVSTTPYPFTAWKTSYIHSAFENVAATVTGAEAAYRALKRRGKVRDDFTFVAFGGDGGTYDIGIQSLSGALERGHDFTYVCYNNEAYMNTGTQRSGATPLGAWTSTTPAGSVVPGKPDKRKDLTAIAAAHNIPYVAQSSPAFWKDLMRKAETAFDTQGPAFINVMAPCPRGWRYPSENTIEMAKLATETCIWPLYEVIDGEWKLNRKPKEKKPVTEWLKPQGRFRHLFKPGNESVLQALQESVDRDWEILLKKCGVE